MADGLARHGRIHGRVACLHAELTQRLNTRAISRTSARITSLLVVDCA
jgi:hypothetical protein